MAYGLGCNHHGREGKGTGELIAVRLKHEVAAQHMAQTRTQEERGQMWAWAVTLKAFPRLIHFPPTRLHLLKVPQHLKRELLAGNHHEPVRTFDIHIITMCRGDCLKPELILSKIPIK